MWWWLLWPFDDAGPEFVGVLDWEYDCVGSKYWLFITPPDPDFAIDELYANLSLELLLEVLVLLFPLFPRLVDEYIDS